MPPATITVTREIISTATSVSANVKPAVFRFLLLPMAASYLFPFPPDAFPAWLPLPSAPALSASGAV